MTASDKVRWKPGTLVYPAPVALISCGDRDRSNIITVAWTGNICTEPAMTYISVRPSRFSYGLIKKSGEFIINIATAPLAFAADFCGVKSGNDIDKFEHLKLTGAPATHVAAPIIAESPVNIECRVTQIMPLGSHDMFIATVLGVNADASVLDRNGYFNFERINPICYCHGHYYLLGKRLGKFGFSVAKNKKSRRAVGADRSKQHG